MAKKNMNKVIDLADGTVTFKDLSTEEAIAFSVSDLPEEIQNRLLLHGLSSKLGAAGAGKESGDAIPAMTEVFDALSEGRWTTRPTATKLPSKGDLLDKLSNMDEETAAATKAALAACGIAL